MTTVFEIGEQEQALLKAYYRDACREKAPDYALFQAKTEYAVVTCYTSGKVVLQGKQTDEEAGRIAEVLGRPIGASGASATADATTYAASDGTQSAETFVFEDRTAIGSDEVGTGDFFGPVVVAAAFVRKEQFEDLRALGVRDSKKITDKKITEIAEQIMRIVPYECVILENPVYNRLHAEGINANAMKTMLHNVCLYRLRERVRKDLGDAADSLSIVVDQFAPKALYEGYLAEIRQKADRVLRYAGEEAPLIRELVAIPPVGGITFMTKAENKCMAVGAASVIARKVFLEEMDKMAKALGVEEIPFGAGAGVDAFAQSIGDKELLAKYTKVHFGNYERLEL